MDFKIELPTLKVSQEDLVADLRRVSELVGANALKRREYDQYGKYSSSSCVNHFGSWKKATEAAGLKPSRNWGSTSEEMLENLKDVWIRLGRQPKYSDMTIPFSTFSFSAYEHKFGNWTNALIAFQTYLEADSALELIKPADGMEPYVDGHRTKRNPNWRLRFKVMKRDNFRCVACGRSPAKDTEVELHVDHVRPWSKGGETIIDNLQTLCQKCNLGKSNVE